MSVSILVSCMNELYEIVIRLSMRNIYIYIYISGNLCKYNGIQITNLSTLGYEVSKL